jgi:plasmid stability protein
MRPLRSAMRPRLPDDLARAVHARAVREGRTGQSMLEQIVRAGLHTINNSAPLPPSAPVPSTDSAHDD